METCPQCGLDWDGKYCTNCRYGSIAAKPKSSKRSRLKKLNTANDEYSYNTCIEYKSLGEAISGGISAYFTGIIPIFIIVLITSIICFGIVYGVVFFLNPEFLNLSNIFSQVATVDNSFESALAASSVFIPMSLAMFLLWYFVINHYQSTAILCFADNKYKGNDLGSLGLIGCIGSMLQACFGVFHILIPRFLAFLIFKLCYIALIIPAIYVFPCLAFVDSWAIFRGRRSIMGSFSLAKGRWLKIFGCVILFKVIPFIFICIFVTFALIMFPALMLSLIKVPYEISTILILAVATTIWHISTVAFYHIFRYLEKEIPEEEDVTTAYGMN